MTAQEMRTNFLIGYDYITNYQAPGLENSEISHFLTVAQFSLIYNYYDPKRNSERESADQTEKRKKDLSNLFKRGSSNSFSSNGSNLPNGVYVNLPNDLMWIESENVKIESSSIECLSEGAIVDVVPITHDKYNLIKKSPFRKPSKERVLRLDIEAINNVQRHELILPSGVTLDSYNFIYIKNPNNIDIDNNITSELNPQIHQRIVDYAVLLALESVNNPRFQTKALTNSKLE